jgi:hypothetical protein
VIVKGEVHYTTNTLPDDSTEPMRVFWQDISATYTPDMPPITGPLHFKNPGNSPGWSFSGLTADDVSGILVGNDQANGWVNAYLPKSDGEIDILWQRDLRTSNHPSIVSDREMVYVTDYVDGHNHLVVLDLLSGEELLRIPTPATRASLSNIVHTTNNETFFTSYEPGEQTGFVLRLYVPEDGAEGTVYPYTGQTNINPQVFMIITLLNLIRSPQAILILVSGVVLLVVILGFVLIQKRRHK